jgi:hypothetical protein
MKRLTQFAALILTLSFVQGVKAEVIQVQELDDQALQQELANPDPLADADALSAWINQYGRDDRDHGRDYRGRDRDRDRDRDYRDRRRRRPGRVVLNCFARDAFNRTYRATAVGTRNTRNVQQRAVNACRRSSVVPFTCRAIGCRYVR